MAREVLSNGVIVPEKYTRDWFDDFRTNLVKLNDAITAIAGKQNALTQEQLDAVNSAITSQKVTAYDDHIADTSKHLTDGTAAKAIADEDGTSIKTGYGKLANVNTWATAQVFLNALRFNNTSYVSGTPSENIFYTTLQWGGYVNNTWSAPFTINNAIRTNGYSDTSFRTYSQTSNTLTGFVLETNADASDISFRPIANGTHKLGSSSYQWSSVYAQTYYYNGTAWGLDKENTWSQNQVIASSNDKCYFVKDTVYELGQSYSNGEHLGGLTICDKNGATVGLIDIVDRSYGNMEMRIRVQQKFDPNSNNRSTSGNTLFNEMLLGITPAKTNYIGFNADLWGGNTYNLGTSTNQWASVYAQTYFYNGTAWGLDKANVWTGTQTIEQSTFAQLRLKNPTIKLGDAIPSSQKTVGTVTFSDSDNSNMGFVDFRDSTQGNTFVRIIARQKYDANGNRSTSGTIYESGLDIGVLNDKTPYVVPTSNAAAQLGTSTNKWKTLNGVNPGALSLPSSSYVDIDTTDWDKTGATSQSYTPAVHGWLYISIQNIAGNYLSMSGGRGAVSMDATGVQSGLRATLPVVANESVSITVKTGSIFAARFYPMLGNV